MSCSAYCRPLSGAVSKNEGCLLPIYREGCLLPTRRIFFSSVGSRGESTASKGKTIPYLVLHVVCCRVVSETVSAKQGGVLPTCGGCLLPGLHVRWLFASYKQVGDPSGAQSGCLCVELTSYCYIQEGLRCHCEATRPTHPWSFRIRSCREDCA
jgi:hypothetical protein